MKKPFVLALLGVLLFATGCSDCTDWTYYDCKTLNSTQSLVIQTPDGQWTAKSPTLGLFPWDYDFFDYDVFNPVYENLAVIVSGSNDESTDEKGPSDSLDIYYMFDYLKKGGETINLPAKNRVVSSRIHMCVNYNQFPAEITGGTLKVLALGPKDVHIRIQGLKVKGTPTKGKYAGQAVEWEIKTVIDYECKPTRKTLCQDSRHNPF